MTKYTKKLIIVFGLLAVVFVACSPKIIQVPVVHTEYVTVRDTTILHKTDTLVQVPEVSIADYINVADTLRLEAPYAVSKAWVDTTSNTLKGTLKQGGKLPVQIVEKERVVYRDSISYQEKIVPVEVEKIVKRTPWIMKVLSGIGIIALGLLLGWLIGKYLHKGL